MTWYNLSKWGWMEPEPKPSQSSTTPPAVSDSSESPKASTSAPDSTSSSTSADWYDWDYAPLDPQPHLPGDKVELTREELKRHTEQGWSSYKAGWRTLHPPSPPKPANPHPGELGQVMKFSYDTETPPEWPTYNVKWTPMPPPPAVPKIVLHPEQVKLLQAENWDLGGFNFPKDISSPDPNPPTKASKPKRNPHSRPTRPIGSKTSNTSNPSAHMPYPYGGLAHNALVRENLDPTWAPTNEPASNAEQPSPNTNSSLSLTQWFDTLMGLSGRLTPKRSPDRATTLARIGPDALKRKFICTHLARCTRNSVCPALRSTWLVDRALRPDAPLSSIASMILAAHRMR